MTRVTKLSAPWNLTNIQRTIPSFLDLPRPNHTLHMLGGMTPLLGPCLCPHGCFAKGFRMLYHPNPGCVGGTASVGLAREVDPGKFVEVGVFILCTGPPVFS